MTRRTALSDLVPWEMFCRQEKFPQSLQTTNRRQLNLFSGSAATPQGEQGRLPGRTQKISNERSERALSAEAGMRTSFYGLSRCGRQVFDEEDWLKRKRQVTAQRYRSASLNRRNRLPPAFISHRQGWRHRPHGDIESLPSSARRRAIGARTGCFDFL